MHKSILLAASMATILVLATAHRPAEAQGGPGAKSATTKAKATKPNAPLIASAPGKRTVARGKLRKTAGFLPARKGPGQCGTYMYWKGGKCVDTRLPSK